MPGFEIVDVPSDWKPLFCALVECGIRNDGPLLETIARLTRPPESLHMPTPDQVEDANSVLKTLLPIDRDMAGRMLRLDDGQPDPAAKWSDLSRAERKRAERLWSWALDTGLETAPQGRPHNVDAALVLYCARIVVEACGRSNFQFSRPAAGGAPRGPMWRALIAALPLAQSFLARLDAPAHRPPAIGKRAETIADIVKTSRSKHFEACCRELGIGPTANDVAAHPATFRLALARARARRKPARRK
jgi:hypothetical protein